MPGFRKQHSVVRFAILYIRQPSDITIISDRCDVPSVVKPTKITFALFGPRNFAFNLLKFNDAFFLSGGYSRCRGNFSSHWNSSDKIWSQSAGSIFLTDLFRYVAVTRGGLSGQPENQDNEAQAEEKQVSDESQDAQHWGSLSAAIRCGNFEMARQPSTACVRAAVAAILTLTPAVEAFVVDSIAIIPTVADLVRAAWAPRIATRCVWRGRAVSCGVNGLCIGRSCIHGRISRSVRVCVRGIYGDGLRRAIHGRCVDVLPVNAGVAAKRSSVLAWATTDQQDQRKPAHLVFAHVIRRARTRVAYGTVAATLAYSTARLAMANLHVGATYAVSPCIRVGDANQGVRRRAPLRAAVAAANITGFVTRGRRGHFSVGHCVWRAIGHRWHLHRVGTAGGHQQRYKNQLHHGYQYASDKIDPQYRPFKQVIG